jgi:hypothetical protein
MRLLWNAYVIGSPPSRFSFTARDDGSVCLCGVDCTGNALSCREVCMRREHCARSLRGPGIMEADEQVICPAVSP